MVLRAVAVGVIGLLSTVSLGGCVRAQPVAAPTVVAIDNVRGGDLTAMADAPDYGGVWRAHDEVDVEWHGSWWPAVILEKRHGRWLVHYEGYGDEWDEVVGGDRIRERRAEPRVEDEPSTDEEPDP